VYFWGFDLGSRHVKIVKTYNMQDFQKLIFDTIEFYKRFGRRDGEFRIELSSLGVEEGDTIVATGYGRNTVALKGVRIISELQAHTIGAVFQTGFSDFLLVDAGGQDTKVILVKDGEMQDFTTSDKCGAASGRFLEAMAELFKLPLKELGKFYEDPIPISATCGIYAESEVVSRLFEGVPLERICAGINSTIARRIIHLARKFNPETIVFTGGIAQNQAVCKIVEQELGCRVIVPQEPVFNGAIGCCVGGKQFSEEGLQ